MKKFGLLIMPLMAISFLASCGNNNSITLTFDFDGGIVNNKNSMTMSVNKGCKWKDVKEKPTPTKTGYTFDNFLCNDIPLRDEYVFDNDSTIFATYKVKTANNFATDDWGTISREANKGINHLVDLYKPNDGTFIITKNDITPEQIAAKTRMVKVGNRDCKVRVIGECCDEILGVDEYNDHSILTFEFVDVLDIIPFSLPEDPAGTLYSKSYARKYLSNDFLSKLPSDFVDLVKYTYIDDSSQHDTPFYDKFFVPSPTQLQMTDDSDEEFGVVDTLYSFYAINQNKSLRAKRYIDFDGIDHGFTPYMLRSISITRGSTDGEIDSILESGVAAGGFDTRSRFGISPIFNIGSDVYSRRAGCIGMIYFTGNGYTLEGDHMPVVGDALELTIVPKKYNIGGEEVALHKIPKKEDVHFVLDGKYIHTYDDRQISYDESTGTVTIDPKHIGMYRTVVVIANGEIAIPWEKFIGLVNAAEEGTFAISNYFDLGDYIKMYDLPEGEEEGSNICRIVDFSHDSYEKDTLTKKAAITFDTKSFHLTNKPWHGGTNIVEYTKSTLNANLTDENNPNSFVSVLKARNAILYNALKLSKKIVSYKDETSGEEKTKEVSLKIFAPSMTEFFGDDFSKTCYFYPGYPSEGSRYALFNSNSWDDFRGSTDPEFEMFLRTPSFETLEAQGVKYHYDEQNSGESAIPRPVRFSYEETADNLGCTPFFAI